MSGADQKHPRAAALVGRGKLFALSDGKGIVAERNGGGRVRAYAAMRVAADWIATCGVDWSDAPAARTALLGFFDDWSEELTALIRCSDDTIVPRPLYALPSGHAWTHVPGVTLLGDAAHLMSPFAGEGANLAMLDATELALALVATPDDVEGALVRYETAMFPRSAAAAAVSAENLELCFRDDAPGGLVRLMAGYQGAAREE
jgi:2-polyprenyl-6-methoxyphenol hydroxylase-like FAD-dependent oxidoreductase